MDLQKAKVTEKESNMRLLEEVFEFTSADLLINKQGSLSDRQIKERYVSRTLKQLGEKD